MYHHSCQCCGRLRESCMCHMWALSAIVRPQTCASRRRSRHAAMARAAARLAPPSRAWTIQRCVCSNLALYIATNWCRFANMKDWRSVACMLHARNVLNLLFQSGEAVPSTCGGWTHQSAFGSSLERTCRAAWRAMALLRSRHARCCSSSRSASHASAARCAPARASRASTTHPGVELEEALSCTGTGAALTPQTSSLKQQACAR